MPLIAKEKNSSPFSFNQRKAIQAVAFLLKQNYDTNCSDNYTRLLKLLYFADRQSIKETGSPITGDRFVAMEYGPTLSNLLDFVKQQRPDNMEWDKYIQKNGFNIRLIKDPGNDELCRYEIELLNKIWQQYREKGDWEIVEESHKLLEWQQNNPGKSSKFIPLRDVLNALGLSSCSDDIETVAIENKAAHQLFGAGI